MLESVGWVEFPSLLCKSSISLHIPNDHSSRISGSLLATLNINSIKYISLYVWVYRLKNKQTIKFQWRKHVEVKGINMKYSSWEAGCKTETAGQMESKAISIVWKRRHC